MHCPPRFGYGEEGATREGKGDLVAVQVQDGSEAQVPALILSAQQAAGGRRQQAKCGWGGRQGKRQGGRRNAIHRLQCEKQPVTHMRSKWGPG